MILSCGSSDSPSEADHASSTTVSSKPEITPLAPAYSEVANQLGLIFTYQNDPSETYHIAEIVGGGAAAFDADGDGDMDLFLPQGRDPHNQSADQAGHVFMRNRLIEDGDLSFEARPMGWDGAGYGLGATVGDPNGDGHPDVYVTRFGLDQLWINQGDGSFLESSDQWGLKVDDISAGAAFFDLEGDGDDDLIVARYVRNLTSPPVCDAPNGLRDYCAPHAWPAAHNVLLRNDGDRFTDVSAEYGIVDEARYSLMVLPWDVDGDGAIDLIIANDAMDNRLWMNRGNRLVDEAPERGVAVNATGMAEASMGVELLDANRDGEIDLLMTHFSGESNTLYLSDSEGFFLDESFASGLAGPTLPYTGWGVKQIDANRDGWTDLVVANGRASMGLPTPGSPINQQLAQSNQFFLNSGQGHFVSAVGDMPAAFVARLNSRAVVTADFDNNGRVDILVTNAGDPVQLFLDDAAPGAWIGLVPEAENGAPVFRGYAIKVNQQAVVNAPQGGYASYSDARMVIALQVDEPLRIGDSIIAADQHGQYIKVLVDPRQ